MAKKKYDGVIEAVHYDPEGRVDWVRAYLWRGMVFSDRILLDRQTLVEDLKAGKRYLVGERVQYQGATFETDEPLRILERNGDPILVVGDRGAEQDLLDGVPVI